MAFDKLKAMLLHYANSQPPINRTEFYALKERLLRKHGKCVGGDIQEIRKECWGPWGDQYGERAGCLGAKCHRCNGTGVFEIKWISLERWEWCGYVFHRPAFRLYAIPDIGTVTIFGRIEHEHSGQICSEAALWLYLLCGEWRLFWQELSTHSYHRCRFYPLLNIQRLMFKARLKFGIQKCWCGKKFFHWGSGWQVCKKCREPKAVEACEEIPF